MSETKLLLLWLLVNGSLPKICYSKILCAISMIKPITDKPGVMYFLPLCTVTFSKNEDISSKGILHISGLGLLKQFSERHHPSSILEHAVVSIYHSTAFRFRVLLTTLTQSFHALPLCCLRRVCHGYLFRQGKRHSSPLFCNVETAHVGPAEIAHKKRGAMDKKMIKNKRMI